MPPSMRGPRAAAEGDRRTAWEIARKFESGPNGPEVDVWIEDGKPLPPESTTTELAVLVAAALESERKRTTVEVATNLTKNDRFDEGDHVRIADRQSRHNGKSALVWFSRDGRVMVSMAEPGSIGGSVTDSFIPEHLERLEDPAPVNLERAVLLRFMRENAHMHDNLSSTQGRCTALLLATRAMRQKIVELGGEDPGPP